MAIPQTAPSTATAPIRVVWREVYARWGRQVSSAGVFCCRRIGAGACNPSLPGGSWSQHAWGNAWDITGPTSVLDAVAAFLSSAQMRPHVAQVLWRVPDHYGHIHVSGRPMRTGTPRCARGAALGVTTPSEVQPSPLPTAAEVAVSETWAPAARTASRLLLRAAGTTARYADLIEARYRRV